MSKDNARMFSEAELAEEVWQREHEERSGNEQLMRGQPTGGQPTPEAVVEAMAETGQIPAWVPEFEKAWDGDRGLIDILCRYEGQGELIYKSAFLAGWIAGQASVCRCAGFDPEAARESEVAG